MTPPETPAEYDALVETVAKALFRNHYPGATTTSFPTAASHPDHWRRSARVALSALGIERPAEKSLGQVAYEAVRQLGRPWEQLLPDAQRHWETVADAVVAEYERRKEES